MNEQTKWTVQSESDPDKQYEVIRVGDKFACSCPDCSFRNRECKHIKKIKMRLAGAKQRNKLCIDEHVEHQAEVRRRTGLWIK